MRRIGLLLVVALASTSCAVLGFTPPCGGTELVGEFEQVGDLVNNANVQSSDVVVGSVTDIELDRDDWEARVTMCIDEDERIPADLEAVVRTTSLLGEKFIDLQPQTVGPPFLHDGDVIDADRTSKATELEEVFSRLATILGAGNLEDLNRFTGAQAAILRENADDLKDVLDRLHRFTNVVAGRKDQIARAIDSLDDVARTIRADSSILRRFLRSFADSSGVLASEKRDLQDLLFALDRFSAVSLQLLDATEEGLDRQFADLRPVLSTVVANSQDLVDSLRTLATFSEMFPESMPGDYLQLDVCAQLDESYTQGRECPQAINNDDPSRSPDVPASSVELILRQPLRGER